MNQSPRTIDPVVHFSLNPAPQDILSENSLRVLADDFMRRFGYEDQPYVVFLHDDIDRPHLHIVSVRVDDTGKPIDHYKERVRARNICREMEKEYGLYFPITKEDYKKDIKEQRQAGFRIPKIDYTESNLKAQIKSVTLNILDNYKCTTEGELNIILKRHNIDLIRLRGEHDGQKWEG